MNNEEKILAMLEQLQQGQATMQGDIEGLKQGQATMQGDIEGLKQGQATMQGDIGGLKQGQATMQGDIGGLKQGQTKLEQGQAAANVRLDKLELGQTTINSRLDATDARLDSVIKSQIIVENEWFPKVMAALEGVSSLIEQKHIDRDQITALEDKVEELDIRTISLVPKRKTL